jgi:polyphosphate glucokinase
MVLPDHLFIGGGNAKQLDPTRSARTARSCPNISGLLGGIALWERVGTTALAEVPAPAKS